MLNFLARIVLYPFRALAMRCVRCGSETRLVNFFSGSNPSFTCIRRCAKCGFEREIYIG